MEVAIRASLRQILEECSTQELTEVAQKISNTLQEKGLNSLKHVKYVQAEDLKDIVSEFQARRIVQGWKTYQFLAPEQTPQAGTSNEYRPSHANYKIPLNKIVQLEKRERIKTELEQGNKFDETDQLALVNACVLDAMEKWPGCKREIMKTIAEILIDRYPNCFLLKVGDNFLGKAEFIAHMKNQFDNKHRGKKTKGKKSNPQDFIDQRRVVGAKNWLPDPTSDEDLEKQIEIQTEMINMYQLNRKEWDWHTIEAMLQATLTAQRNDINAQTRKIDGHQIDPNQNEDEGPSTEVLFNSWPFLFEPLGMAFHFKQVTSVDIQEKIENYELNYLVQFLVNQGGVQHLILQQKMEAAKKTAFHSPELLAMVIMLIKYFGENQKFILGNVDKTKRFVDLSNVYSLEEEPLDIPETPSIMISGEKSFEATKFYLCMDKRAVAATRSFREAFIFMMSSYYVFNLLYHPEVSMTLEFIQREILGINPEKGSRRSKANKRCSKVPSKILQLVTSIRKFKKTLKEVEANSCN